MALRASVLVAAVAALLAVPATASAIVPWPDLCPTPGVTVPVEGEPHVLDASCSFDPDGHDLVRYEWDLDGDGQFETSATTPLLTHTFTDRGRYADATVDVGIRITDSAGETGSWTIPLKITDSINSWFLYQPKLVNPGDTISLDAWATPDDWSSYPTLTYEWDLDGDGSFETSTGLLAQASTVAPETAGNHPISLRITDSLGNSSTVKRLVEVLPRHPSRDQQPWLAPQNLGNAPVVEQQAKEIREAVDPAAPAAAPIVPAEDKAPVQPRKRPKLSKIDANRNGLALRYTGGPKWSLWKVVVRLPADRAASYGLGRKAIVMARGKLVFDANGVGRARMRWTPGAYRLFRKVQHSTIDILARRYK